MGRKPSDESLKDLRDERESQIVFLPMVIYYINRIKKFEESDVTDTDASYNIFKYQHFT